LGATRHTSRSHFQVEWRDSGCAETAFDDRTAAKCITYADGIYPGELLDDFKQQVTMLSEAARSIGMQPE